MDRLSRNEYDRAWWKKNRERIRQNRIERRVKLHTPDELLLSKIVREIRVRLNDGRRKNAAKKRKVIKRRMEAQLWALSHPEEVIALAEKKEALKKEAKRVNSRIQRHVRRARERGIDGRMSIGLKEKLTRLQRGKCVYCKVTLDKSHMDHIIPLVLGGSGRDDNYQLLCPACNVKKSAKHPIQYANEIGLLL